MRLYRIIGAAWAGTQADAKRSAGEHGAPWHETEVPTDKPGLLAWLNERNVPAKPEEIGQLEQLRQPLERDPMDGGGAVIDRAEVDRVNATRPPFLGKLTAEEIERHRMAMGQCPKCSSSPASAERWRRDLDFESVRAWIEKNATALGLDELSDLIEEKRK